VTNYTTLSLTASVKSLVFILSILGMSTIGYNQQIQLNLSAGETQTLELSQVNGMKITGHGTLQLVCGSQGIQIKESLVLGNQVKLVCDETIQLVGSGILQASRLNSNISIQGEWELRSDLTLKPEKEAHFQNATINLGSSSIVSDNLIFSGVNLIHTNGGVIVANKSFLSNEQLEVESSQADVIFIPELAEFTGSTDLPVHFFSSAGNSCGDPEFEITVEVISDYNGADISCNGADDAEVQCVVTGGVGPFVCEWFGGTGDNTGETYSGLGAGTYTVLVTDEGQNVICVENVQIAEPPPLAVFTLNLMMPSCVALCNGSTNPIVLGGTGLYTFDYSNGGMNPENLNLCTGVNTVMISDDNDCQLDTTFVINEDSIDIDLLYTDSLCFGDNFGVASVSPSGGGGGPYDIDWSTNEATNAISNLSSGTYSVEILYAEDCSIDSTFTIVGLGELIVTIDESESPVCVSDTTGIISVSISGGTPEYTLAWTKEGVPFSIEEDLSDLGIGVYELSVTDAFGCIGSLSLNLEAQEEVIVETTLVEIDCFENCNASITSTIIQAQEPITFTWSDVNGIISNAEFIENICAGTYELVVMDGAGCEYIETFIIDEPEEMEVLEDITNISCNGLAEGAILLTVSGGSAPYSTSLPSIESNPGEFVLDNLIAGSYVVDVTDEEGCVVSVPFELTEPEALLVDLSFEDPICFGESSGSITLVVSGGSEPYSIEWVELGVFDELIQSDLPSGDYNILITDAQGCEESLTVTLEDPLEITVVETTNPVLCNGDSTGSIELEVSNPIGNLNVLWVGNVINNTELNQFDLQAGVYEVTLTDDNGCEFNSAYEILESPELEVTETIINPLCFGEQGEISIEINGGQEPYDVSWAEIEAPNQQIITDLPTGIYTVAVTDANLCEVTASYQITLPDEIIITAEVTQPDCVLQSGTIEVVNITGGAGSYSFIWLEIDAPDQNLVENLASGDYTIQVTDASNCITEEVYTITEPGVLAVSSEVTNVLCNGENTGSILLEASGGLEPYTAVWTPVLDASLAQENLTAGVYEVTLTDDNGCEFNNTFEITAPDEIIITEDVSVLNCSEDLGAIEISIEGGIEPYGIAWGGIEAPGETLLTELSAGDYSVTVIDDSECEVTEAYSITAPEAIEIVEVITQPNCFGELGVISLEITGGTGLYTIEWTGIEADGDTEILDLIAGTYTVTVTDENGCEEEESYEIILINELAANVNMTQPECFTLNGEAVLAIEGGTEPYSIIWPGIAADDELSASEIAPGSYTVSITDANLCAIEVEFEITEPYELSSETIFNGVLCNGENTGSIDITLINATGVIDYSWVNEELGFTSPTQDIENLFAGVYELTATDEIGCVFNETFEILETEELVITLESIQSETCEGLENGSIEVSISGGTLDYQIDWSGTGFSSNDEDILELASGDYTLNVSDLNGCVATETFTVNSGTLITPNSSSIDSECSVSTGSMSVNIDSDNPIEEISWFDDGVLLTDGLITTIENLSSGTYSVEITDDQGCSVSETILISDTGAVSINAEVSGVNCQGDSNGSILIVVTSGTEPYILTWSGPVEIADDQYNPTNLITGDYIASINDSEGCNTLQEFSVLSPDSFSINETIINVSCFGNGDGVIALELIGGTEPFTIDWMDSDEDLDTLTDLTPGEYSVLITDANDCITEGIYQITEEDVLTLDISFTELFCVNQTSTDIDITVTGGLEPYTFSWTGEVTSTNEDLADAGIGTYTVLVTDAVNCTIEETITIAQGSEILIEVIETQPTCLTNNGSLTASAVGGSGLDYTFFWYSIGDTPTLIGQEPTLDNLESGSYYLEVHDSGGCFNTAEVNLSNNQGEVSVNITNVLCAQDDSGSIEIEVVGLVGTLSVEWAGPNNFTSVDEDISGLTEGEYTVTVTDGNGCQLIETYEVASTNELVEGIEVTNICFGEIGTGAANILLTGGTAPYIINWSGNGLVSNQASITDLNEGCYILEISDANSCSYTEEVCISSLDEIILNTSVTGNVCFADEDGQIELEISGGNPGYSIEWLNSDAEFVSDQLLVTELATGVYTASIIDNSGCMANITASITSSPELTSEVFETPIICFGDENGALDVVYSGGVGALTLTWTGPNGFTSEEDQILNLGNGDYCYEVVGSAGCVISDCYALNDPGPLSLGQTVNSTNCFGTNDGEVSLEVSGGYAPYTTVWTLNGTLFSTEEDIAGLAIGVYAVNLSDTMGCTIEDTFTISELPLLTVVFDNIIGATCATSSDGAFETTVSGGMLNYSYSWVLNGTEESTEEDPSELGAGDYQLTVTDANDCNTEIASVIIPVLGTLEVIVPQNITWCFTEDLQLIETISVEAQSIEWTNPPSTDVLSTTNSVFFQEEPGVYELVITGIDGPCVVTDTVEVTIHELPQSDAGEDQDAELEDEVILGGNPTTDDLNTVVWAPFELLNESSLFNPSYLVVNSIQSFVLTVTSPEGCVSEDSTQVTLSPEVDIHSGFTPNSDNINDVWVIGNLQNYPSIEVWVYNRWGEELFYSQGYNQPWDGTYNGESLPIGTYYYVIDFNKPGFQLTTDGPVTILR
jgi:gliding motility-associated-like protein